MLLMIDNQHLGSFFVRVCSPNSEDCALRLDSIG